jgi:hypothetical protein
VSRFEVDVPVVDALSASVVAAASDVRSALGQMNAAACADTGDPGLTGALSVFQQAWGSFTEAAGHVVDQTGAAISAAASAYQRVDAAVIADPGVTAAFVAEVASGGDGQGALDGAPDVPLRGPR